MGGIDRLSGKRIYFDANIFIYQQEGFSALALVLDKLTDLIIRKRIDIVTSEVTLAEVLVKPISDRDETLIQYYQSLIVDSDFITVIPVNRHVLLSSANLRAANKLKLIDAIHAASAIFGKCDILLTNDARFSSLPDVTTVILGEIA